MYEVAFSSREKPELYRELLPQIRAVIEGEANLTANLANITAVLKQAFSWFWVGFYLVEDDQLVLGPFQGPVACTRIDYDRGVCGQSWASGQTIVVPDVNRYAGHIACSSFSQSEIVVPIFNEAGNVVAVLDVDSDQLNQFDQTDADYLAQICLMISKQHFN
ncbi:MAG: GAF domain-containing protein [Neisseria sp.]|uniref:GAF domain-containing protein n=1 Tax=Neisseria sp. TaxID=192066 RepID=UPI0026DBAF64|nr:GAF domain-containing protein [Neisseria sp.]MDO4641182.1 GAF domain-containing protein [Neisseria sp.]